MDFVDEFYADKDLSLLKKLTLVIPTYNRNYYLSRCLWYHAHFPFGEIIVADSSPEEKKVVNRETVAKVREQFGANVRYLEYEPETEKYGGDIYRKWGNAMQHVNTEYSQICIDKEFLIPTTLYKEILFLENNLDYVSVEGIRCWIDKHGEKINYLTARDFEKTSSITSESPMNRYVAALSTSTSVLMLYRSSVQKKVYQYLKEYGIQDIRFGESLITVLGYILGKSEHLREDIVTYRDVIQLNRRGKLNTKESSASRYPSLCDYVQLGVFDQFFNAYKECLIDVLSKELSLVDRGEIEKTVNMSQPNKYDIKIKDKQNKTDISRLVVAHPIINTLWKKTPMIIKQPIRVITGYDDSKWYLTNISKDALIISMIIENESQFQDFL